MGAVIAVLAFLLGAAFKPYLSGYSKKKGENLATQEDIDEILRQLKTQTQATEEIKSEISGGLWDRQKQWEMKKEVLFEASKSIASVEEQLMRMQSVLSTAKDRIEQPEWMASWHEALVEWREDIATFERTEGLVTVVCSLETNVEFLKLRSVVGAIAGALAKRDLGVLEERWEDLTKAAYRVRFAIRKELGVPTPEEAKSSEGK